MSGHQYYQIGDLKKYYLDFELSNGLSKSDLYSKSLLSILNNSVTFNSTPAFDLTEQAKLIHGTIESFDKQVLKHIKKLKRYKAVLSTVFVFPIHNLIGHIANTLGEPVINWQHGEMNMYYDIFTDSVETKYSTHYLAYGDGVIPKYEAYIGHSPIKKVFNVGSPKRSIVSESNRFILYATGKWMKTATPFIEAQDPDSRLYNAQRDILEYLVSISSEHEVVFKGNNTPGLNEIPFRHKNIKIYSSTPFTTLLKHAKLVILDTPSTTCIETCSTQVPLFVLTGRANWYEKPTKKLQKRAMLAETTDELIKYIKDYLEIGKYDSDTKNTEFLTQYGSGYTPTQAKKML